MKSGFKARFVQGFALIEALASVVLVAVGVSATVASLGALSRSQRRAIENEEMQRLAFRTYDEIVALDELPTGKTSGDYASLGETRFVWQAVRSATGIGNLDSITVGVSRVGDGFNNAIKVEGLLCGKATQVKQ